MTLFSPNVTQRRTQNNTPIGTVRFSKRTRKEIPTLILEYETGTGEKNVYKSM